MNFGKTIFKREKLKEKLKNKLAKLRPDNIIFFRLGINSKMFRVISQSDVINMGVDVAGKKLVKMLIIVHGKNKVKNKKHGNESALGL